jgi:hypothetical protein
MLMLWDCECDNCGALFEEWADGVTAPLCPSCGSAFTKLLPGGIKSEKAKDPYDYLDKRPPDTKKIVVGPRYRSK